MLMPASHNDEKVLFANPGTPIIPLPSILINEISSIEEMPVTISLLDVDFPFMRVVDSGFSV